MSLSPRKRFEVFKRDDFTCRYCGRKSPDVVLEVDHIIPRAEGGSDDEMNLVTSCWECNRGKAAVPLDQVMTGEDPHDRAILELERQRQLEEYNEVLRQIRAYKDLALAELEEHWIGNSNRFINDPDLAFLRRQLDHHPTEEIKDAMDIALSKGKVWGLGYVAGILKTWRIEGRD